ncbi:porin/voltage-dependent anion-selective channel protein [Medicago truncatula]|uniref:Porin/voltage-dependent anion-selective channel protein n=1 Tax=Medicago truncatula TaxID=3880 RepID=G7LCB3_MEDTR|nr:porin/voltage-dependent anion-selective channel protein [Medicago truncatula]
MTLRSVTPNTSQSEMSLLLLGRAMTDGRVTARVKYDVFDNLTLKANAQLTSEPHMSQGMINFDYKGKDYRTQFQMGNGALLGASYIQVMDLHAYFCDIGQPVYHASSFI